MKGIILVGDSGNKLHPLTQGIPKQLLPLYDRPMVFYPIETLTKAGITEILIISSPEFSDTFKKALGDGSKFNAHFSYATQDTPNGIAQAIAIGKDFIGNDSICLITGDTIIVGDGLTPLIIKAGRAVSNSGCATIFVNRDNDPNQYGKVIMNQNGKVETIVGSSDNYNYCSITGLYVYPNNELTKIEQLQPSERGLYEITDLNSLFFKENKMQVLQHP